MMQIFSIACSLTCLALAVATVSNESWSWRLGVKNYQLIVLGFVLGIMQLCLVSVAPPMFLLLEARFGPSTLQNYEGLLRNQVLSTGLSYVWRFILTVMVILPLGLSVAYKTFTGGESIMITDATEHNPAGRISYGMFVPPGLQLLGAETGISLFANVTIPYIVASSTKDAPEPQFSMRERASGYNVLSLNNESTAMLDIPDPDFVSQIQNMLAGGESWNLTSPVFGTVATFNHSRAEDLRTFNNSFQDVCEAAQQNISAFSHIYAGSGFALDLIDHPSPGDQSLQYVSLGAVAGIDNRSTCQNLSNYVQPYDITRKNLQWHVVNHSWWNMACQWLLRRQHASPGETKNLCEQHTRPASRYVVHALSRRNVRALRNHPKHLRVEILLPGHQHGSNAMVSNHSRQWPH